MDAEGRSRSRETLVASFQREIEAFESDVATLFANGDTERQDAAALTNKVQALDQRAAAFEDEDNDFVDNIGSLKMRVYACIEKLRVLEQPKSLSDQLKTYSPQPNSRLLSLSPADVRLRILKLVIPQNERIVLDPAQIKRNHPLQRASFSATRADISIETLPFLVCKQLRSEVLPLLFSGNNLSVANPFRSELIQYTIHEPISLGHIKCLELFLKHGIYEVNQLWTNIRMGDLPTLEDVEFVFFHSDKFLEVLYELVVYLGHRTCKQKLKLELHKSSWAVDRPSRIKKTTIKGASKRAVGVRNTFDVNLPFLPDHVKTVTVKASEGPGAYQALKSFVDVEGNRFEPDEMFSDTAYVRHLVLR